MYGKLEDNILKYAPKTLKLDDGRIILNFNKSIDIMKAYGYKEVINDIPTYDPNTEYIRVSGYNEDDDYITVNYEVLELEEPQLTFEQILSEEVNN